MVFRFSVFTERHRRIHGIRQTLVGLQLQVRRDETRLSDEQGRRWLRPGLRRDRQGDPEAEEYLLHFGGDPQTRSQRGLRTRPEIDLVPFQLRLSRRRQRTLRRQDLSETQPETKHRRLLLPHLRTNHSLGLGRLSRLRTRF